MAPVTYLGGLHDLKVVSDDEEGKVFEPDVYNGFDHATGTTVSLYAGDQADVSVEMAKRLADDHPGYFEIDGTVAKKRQTKAQEAADPGDRRAQLLTHTRNELNAAAAELGVEEPDKFPNKDAVADAILAKADEQKTRDELSALSREELNAAAAEHGIEGAEELESDEAVIDALLAQVVSEDN